jgi:uncharacterized phage-associated protein
MHSALLIANEIIRRGAAESPPRYFTPMQLLKLVYLCHGWMLGLYGRPLIKEDVQAWKYGPVIPELYQSLKVYCDGQVPRPLSIAAPCLEELDVYESTMVDQVMQMYGKQSGIALSQITHAADTPWSLTFQGDQLGQVISNDLIMDHYQRIYTERTQHAAATS